MMKDKTFLSTVVIMVALLGCLGIGDAQYIPTERPTAPILVTPELHNELTKGGAVSNGGGMSSAAALTNEAIVTNAVLGWNYVHATNCTIYWDGANSWLYVYPQEGGFWYTANLSFQTTIAPACQTGNWIAFHVYDTNGNLFNQVWTYTFK
jgi:hypothetical protein